jgi:hypothetical protein
VPEDAGARETWSLVIGDTEGPKKRGNPKNWSIGTAEGC